LDFIKQAFLKEKKVLKELVKDNPKKFARAKMNIVSAGEFHDQGDARMDSN
jgi:hypothetical protein